ncbi:Uncharacterised protein [Mycobacteroides abscessus subsp. abscessus]|nr:Uncharacterised protein [Mycobacteroides abscessus subsp. abscessus]
MERLRQHAGPVGADAERPQSAAHLPRSPSRKRHSEHLTGIDLPLIDQIRDAPRDGARLAGPRTRQYTHRTARREDCGPLLGVESVEDAAVTCGAGR